METENQGPAEGEPADGDVEMKNVSDDVKGEKKEGEAEVKEDPTASPLGSMIPFLLAP